MKRSGESTEKEVARIPWGLNPILILSYYVLVMTTTGNLISAWPPLKDMMRQRGLREELIYNITAWGNAVSIIGAVAAGFLNDFSGPKSAAMLGQFCSATGWALLFFAPGKTEFLLWIATSLIGITYACVSVSHTHVAALFPGNATMAITLLCVGNDISLGMVSLLKYLSKFIGLERVVFIYCSLNVCLMVLDGFLVPSRPFSEASLQYTDQYEERMALRDITQNQDEWEDKDDPESAERDVSMSTVDIAKAPVMTQFATWHYWGLTLFIALSYFRKQHYGQLHREINKYAGEVSGRGPESAVALNSMVEALLPLSMIPSFLTGVFTNRFGVNAGLLFVNTAMIIVSVFSSIPSAGAQWVAVFVFPFSGSFVFGVMYSYLGAMFGFANLGVLQFPLKLATGAGAFLMLPWGKGVALLPNILWSNRILIVVGIAMYIVIISMMLMPLGGGPVETKNIGDRSKHTRPSAVKIVAKRLRYSVCLNNASFDQSAFRALSTEHIHRRTRLR